MICSKCGFVAKDNDRFCIRCGSPLRMPEPPVKEAPVEEPAPAAEPIEEPIPAEPEIEVPEVEVPEPVPAEPVRIAEPVPEPIPEPIEEPIPEPVPEPIPEPVPEPVPAPAPIPEPVKAEPKKAEPIAEPEKPADCCCKLDKPLSVWGYLWRIVFFSIPVLCIIPLFIMAFSSGINKNSKHFAGAVLILKLIAVLAAIGICIYLLLTTDPAVISNYINTTLEKIRALVN